jgi:hypothetical protein
MVVGVDMVGDSQQAPGCLVDLRLSELNFDRCPAAVPQLEDGIGFDALRLPIVENGGTDRLAIHAEIPDDERLEEQSERCGIAEKAIDPSSQGRRGK